MTTLTDLMTGNRRATVEEQDHPHAFVVRYYLRAGDPQPGTAWTLVDTSRYEQPTGANAAAEHFLAGGGSDLRQTVG